ncbi:MAG: 16S rRNA (cytosine(1402)-N(4))-methyltransferase RsmH [Erysipelothrix sp.]|nr:16S rRNA (cytosine(1402)-N(4))-methyltransferase RsmH [Erysipelothrix sp.]
MKHIPVMLEETLDLLNIHKDGIYIDATLGGGGHSEAILNRLEGGMLLGFDKDIDAIERTSKRLEPFGSQFQWVHSSYTALIKTLKEKDINEVDGVLFDLGVSSPQFDDAHRGFSYRFDARLDMRMDQSQSLSAYEVVNTYEPKDLIRVLRENGEERYAKRIVELILEARPVETTFELVDIIKRAYPNKELKKGHPAKKVFQALRIEVNNEFEEAKDAIRQAIESIKVGGRVVVITFHSLEDRLVKQLMNEYGKPKKVNPRIPELTEESLDYKLITRALKASKDELEYNNRAHSAIVRAIERVK